uniref:VWFA domain-containing protein n=1 Tax=Plectus sambesii TaxID=2011161 RepID=A0A914XG66_9BILA
MVHARGLTRGRLSYVEIASDKGLVFTSPLARRSNCSYEFYSTNSFPCNLLTFIIAVHGYDDFGLNFRRLAIGHCVDTRPIPSPPPAFCDLKQRKLDLVFILDASMPNSSFQVVKTFVKTLLIAYNINGNFTQIGLMTVAATAQPKFMLITSQNGGVPALVDPVPWDGSNGQNMTAALTLLTSTFTQQSNGYRNDAQHLAIYITSNAGFTDGDPIQQANTIRRSGSWGIATVGYGILSGANAANNLIELAGGNRCSYRSGNPTDLNTNGLNFLQSRTCFDGQLCSS